jgi:hypothetical protein
MATLPEIPKQLPQTLTQDELYLLIAAVNKLIAVVEALANESQ